MLGQYVLLLGFIKSIFKRGHVLILSSLRRLKRYFLSSHVIFTGYHLCLHHFLSSFSTLNLSLSLSLSSHFFSSHLFVFYSIFNAVWEIDHLGIIIVIFHGNKFVMVFLGLHHRTDCVFIVWCHALKGVI